MCENISFYAFMHVMVGLKGGKRRLFWRKENFGQAQILQLIVCRMAGSGLADLWIVKAIDGLTAL